MHVAICITAYRNPDDVLACVEALSHQRHAGFEIVVCENGGADALGWLRQALPERLSGGQRLTLLDGGDNPGFAGGVNIAMRQAAQADAWWVLNPDTVPRPDALAALVARLERGDVAAVGGRLVGSDGQNQGVGGRWRRRLGRAVSVGRGVTLPLPSQVEARLDYLQGASMLIGRAMVERVGLMREDYFLYAEEVEWFLRAQAAGLRFGYAPDAVVVHAQGTTTGSGGAIRDRGKLAIYLDERNKLHVTRDRFPALLPVAAPASLALLLVRYGKGRAWRQLGYALSGWRAGLAGERGKPAWLTASRARES